MVEDADDAFRMEAQAGLLAGFAIRSVDCRFVGAILAREQASVLFGFLVGPAPLEEDAAVAFHEREDADPDALALTDRRWHRLTVTQAPCSRFGYKKTVARPAVAALMASQPA